MVLTASTMLELGTPCPAFRLPEPSGASHSPEDYVGAPALLIMFICNHCPYVVHVREELARLGRDCEAWGIPMLAISSNDVEAYPADGPDRMTEEKAANGWSFPYLFDEDQQVAKAFHAACTPEAYLFDADRHLVYRGQLDDSRPGSQIPVTGKDLRAAIEATLAGRPVSADQTPSMGCNIKWKPGQQPDYL